MANSLKMISLFLLNIEQVHPLRPPLFLCHILDLLRKLQVIISDDLQAISFAQMVTQQHFLTI